MKESEANVIIPIEEWNDLQRKLSISDATRIKQLEDRLFTANCEKQRYINQIYALDKDREAQRREINRLKELKEEPFRKRINELSNTITVLEEKNEKILSSLIDKKCLFFELMIALMCLIVLIVSMILTWEREKPIEFLLMMLGAIGSIMVSYSIIVNYK